MRISTIYTGENKFPNTRQIKDRLWVVEEPFICHFNLRGKEYWILVPVGFRTDYGSIPKFLWSIYDYMGADAACFILHDILYAGEIVSRADADWILLEFLKQKKHTWLYRNTIYSAVRTCGGFVWENHTPASKATVWMLIDSMRWELSNKANKWGIWYDATMGEYLKIGAPVNA